MDSTNRQRSEKVMRRLSTMSLEHLEVMDYISAINSGATITSFQIAKHLKKDGRKTGSLLSSLSKIKIDGEPLIKSRGKTSEGLRWKTNPKLSDWDKFKLEIKDILKD
jgi:hypothetical protein